MCLQAIFDESFVSFETKTTATATAPASATAPDSPSTHLIPPHVIIADVSVRPAEQVQRSVMEDRGVERPGGGTGIAPLHHQPPPAGRLAVVYVEVGEPAQLSGEASPEVDVAADWVEAAAVGYACLRQVSLLGR